MLFLFVPIIQNISHFKWIKPLKGAYVELKDPLVSTEGWFNGKYQEEKSNFLNQNFGLRNYYVRLNNQIDYSVFNKANVAKVVVGKGGFLYEDDYINAYYGNNFAGEKKLTERFKKLKAVQDLLQSKGIQLEVVFAPGKASFYPEFIPESWHSEKKQSNYDFSVKLCNDLHINHIDFNAWFTKQKNITPYDLYPKTGIHWSNYGALLAMDSLKKHIEHYTRLNLRDLVMDNVNFSNELRDPDNDIGESMNLLRDIKTLPMPYAGYHWKEDNGAVKPRALFIGDSYFWNIYYEGLTNNFFTDCKFWYYNETVFPENEPERNVKKLDLQAEINKQQIIVLMATECNIQDIGWGFIEAINELFKDEIAATFRKRIYVNLILENIKKNREWMSQIERKASENNVTIEKMMQLDADYIYNLDYGSQKINALLDKTVTRIKKTNEWMKEIKRKAAQKNISIEEMIEMDAKYIYDTELKSKSN